MGSMEKLDTLETLLLVLIGFHSHPTHAQGCVDYGGIGGGKSLAKPRGREEEEVVGGAYYKRKQI